MEALLASFCTEKEASINIDNISRSEVMLLLAQKHRLLASSLEEEKKHLDSLCSKWGPELSSALKDREVLNKQVKELKEKRSRLYVEVRALREQFFALLEKAEELEGAEDISRRLRKEINEVDWRIQTEAITIQQEKEFLSTIKHKMEAISQANLEYQKKAGVEERVRAIADSIGKRTAEAEESHNMLLKKAEESDVAHVRVRELEPVLGPSLRRSEWLGHRIQLHKESAEYWEDRAKREPKTGGGSSG